MISGLAKPAIASCSKVPFRSVSDAVRELIGCSFRRQTKGPGRSHFNRVKSSCGDVGGWQRGQSADYLDAVSLDESRETYSAVKTTDVLERLRNSQAFAIPNTPDCFYHCNNLHQF